MAGSRKAALKAWRTMRGPVWKLRRTVRESKDALRQWAAQENYHLVFLDAASGNPRVGIADALLFRIKPRAKDQIELYVVQLKGGGAGIKGLETGRLNKAAAAVKAAPLIALHDGQELHFLQGPAHFTSK